MNWHEYISRMYMIRENLPGMASKPEFRAVASIETMAELESRLNVTLPPDHRSLLLETNGVMEMLAIDGGEWFENMWLVWPSSEILYRNTYFRREWATLPWRRPFDDLVFFANSGTDGIDFAFPVEKNTAKSTVVAWYPSEGEIRPFAPGLREFVEGWLLGTILL